MMFVGRYDEEGDIRGMVTSANPTAARKALLP